MSTSKVVVGELVHYYAENNLQLSTTCCIQLSQPSPSNTSPLVLNDIETLISKDIWVGRGKGLYISFQIVIDTDLRGGGSKLALVENLGTIIRDAQIWPQLRLDTSLIQSANGMEHSRPGTDTIILCLAQKQQDRNADGYSSHQCASIIASDTKPPKGVSSVSLDLVDIKFTFSKANQNSSAQKRKKVKVDDDEYLDDVEILFLDNDETQYQSGYCHSQPLTQASPTDVWDDFVEARPFSQPAFIDVPGAVHEKTAAQTSLRVSEYLPASGHPTQADSRIASLSTEFPSLGSSRKRQLPRSDTDIKGLSLFHSVKLVDAAIRTLIDDNRTYTAPGITLTCKTEGPKLAKISPALFSPGFMEAISERNLFHCIIARSIYSLQRNTKSAILRQKFARLLESSVLTNFSPEEDEDEVSVDAANRSNQEREAINILKVHIWLVTQRALFNPLAARMIKPMHFKEEDMAGGTDTFDLMLDNESYSDLTTESSHSILDECDDNDDDLFEREFNNEITSQKDELLLEDRTTGLGELNEYDHDYCRYWSDEYLDSDCPVAPLELRSSRVSEIHRLQPHEINVPSHGRISSTNSDIESKVDILDDFGQDFDDRQDFGENGGN